MCKYWRQKTAHPTWQAIGTPKSSSLPGFHLHTTSRFEHRTFLWSQGPRRGLYQWMAITPHPTPSDILPETRQKSQHNLKFCQNNATLFWRYIACQRVRRPSSCVRIMQHYFEVHHIPKVRHTLKWCKSNATLFWGYITCQKVRHTLKLCKSNAPTCAGVTHTSDSIGTLDKCQQASRNFFGGQSISNGSLLQTVQTTVYFLPNWGTSWWCPNTKFVCLIINALAV
jgi:hypothetical protein